MPLLGRQTFSQDYIENNKVFYRRILAYCRNQTVAKQA